MFANNHAAVFSFSFADPCSKNRELCKAPYSRGCKNVRAYAELDEAVCLCPDNCVANGKSVCSNNGTTYASMCHMMKEACETKEPIAADYLGDCRKFLRTWMLSGNVFM